MSQTKTLEFVRKRSGDIVAFEKEKIKNAVEKAMGSDEDYDEEVSTKVARRVTTKLKQSKEDIPTVDDIHILVENTLMDMRLYELAREYITYRDRHKPNIFRKREHYKPFEYPHLHKYVDAIRNSYWVHTEFNYGSDVQDFRVEMDESERECIRRCMLAISQIEVKVKDFWTKIGDRLQKPEIQEVGVTFGESEARHANAYAHLLEILGLNSDFEEVLQIPAIKKRVAYMNKSMKGAKSDDIEDYIESVLLFSLFIENVSLFSQFLIISTFNKEKAVLKGMSNAVAATSLEENIHAMFGADVINTIRDENPEFFDADLQDHVTKLVHESFEAEKAVIEWILEKGDFDFLRKVDVIEYIKHRFNTGLAACGFDEVFDVDPSSLERTKWFDLQINSTTHTDFFSKRSVNYTKKSQSFSENDLF